jgi:hypothetical protein
MAGYLQSTIWGTLREKSPSHSTTRSPIESSVMPECAQVSLKASRFPIAVSMGLPITEYLLQVLSSKSESPDKLVRHNDSGPFGSTEAFLKSKLRFSKDAHGQEICSVVSGEETVGVMMGWERGISERVLLLFQGATILMKRAFSAGYR